jgi:hypothetical protein
MSIFNEDDWVEADLQHGPHDRKHYYTMIERKPLTLDGVVSLFKFLEDVYQGNWSGGYGGAKYGESCKNARLLATAMSDFIMTHSNEAFKAVLSHANATEHNVHNNGFFFNKFINETALHWGTDPSKVRIAPKHFFSVYYAAKDLLDSQAHNNFHSIADVMKAYEETSLKDLPNLHTHAVLGDAVHYIKGSQYMNAFLHPRGKYSTMGSDNWIECGLNCKSCKENKEYTWEMEQQMEQQLKSSLTSGTVPIASAIDAPFPKAPAEPAKTVVNYVKKLSKEDELTDNSVQLLAKMVVDNWTPLANKYLALIVSKFTTDQLLLFAKTQQEMKE